MAHIVYKITESSSGNYYIARDTVESTDGYQGKFSGQYVDETSTLQDEYLKIKRDSGITLNTTIISTHDTESELIEAEDTLIKDKFENDVLCKNKLLSSRGAHESILYHSTIDEDHIRILVNSIIPGIFNKE